MTDDDPDECGDVYTLTAMESDTKLFNDLESRRSTTSPIPLFTSDDWDPFEIAPLNVYGIPEQPLYCGIGRKTRPILVPPEDLKYAPVCKKIAKDTSYGSETYKPYLDIEIIINIQSVGSINRGHDRILMSSTKQLNVKRHY